MKAASPDCRESALGNVAGRGQKPWHGRIPIISLPLIHLKLQLVLQFVCSQPSGSDSGLVDHPLPHTQAFLKEFVICLASCMQINQPTMKGTEQSTKITLKTSANSHFQGREAQRNWDPERPWAYSRGCTNQYMQGQHREAFLTQERLNETLNVLCERCKIFKIVTLPSIPIHDPMVL